MKRKQPIIYIVVFVILLPGYIVAVNMLQQDRTPEQQKLHFRNLPFHEDVYYVTAGEFAGLIADFLYLDIAATLGGRRADLLDEDEWNKVEKIFTTAVRLDPYFEPTFRAIQAYLPWSAKRPLRAITLLEKVSEKRTWHWMPPFYIGFNHYFFLKDNTEASHNFLEAAERENAPPMLATLGARLAAASGNATIGINFLQRLMATTENPQEKRIFKQRIEALQGVDVLEKAIAKYRRDYGVNPPFLLALIITGYLDSLPKNPYHPTYFYKDGVIRFDPFPTPEDTAAQKGYDNKAGRKPPLLLNKQNL